MKINPTIRRFIGFYALCVVVQVAGSYFTSAGVVSWYPALVRSPLNPPGYVFGIAWTLLYIAMAVAAALALPRLPRLNTWPLRWWLLQMLLGLLWCVVFFGAGQLFAGVVVLVATLVSAIVTAVLFWRVRPLAGWLLLPLVCWLTLATHLNLYIYLHN